MLVIVEVFVAQGQAIDALGEQLFHRVLDEERMAVVGKAAAQAAEHPEAAVELAQEQRQRRTGRKYLVAIPISAIDSEGAWRMGGVTFRDEVTIVRVLDDGSAKFDMRASRSPSRKRGRRRIDYCPRRG